MSAGSVPSSSLTCSSELIRDYRRSKQFLSEYDKLGVQRVVDASNALYQDIQTVTEPYKQRNERVPADLLASLISHSQCLQFHRRCGLAYLNARLDRIRQLWWDSDGAIEPHGRHASEYDAMSGQEKSFLEDYGKMVVALMDDTGLTLTERPLPPTSLYSRVRVLADHPPVLGSDGSQLELRRDTMKRIRRTDAERLCRSGVVQHIQEFNAL